MKQKFAVFDVDGTIYRSSLFLDLFMELIRLKQVPSSYKTIINTTIRNHKNRTNNESYDKMIDSAVNVYYQLMPTIDPAINDKAVKTVLRKNSNHVYRFTKNLIKKLKKEGYFLISISGSNHDIVEQFGKIHKFDLSLGTTHETNYEGYKTGKDKRITYENKHLVLQTVINEYNLTLKDSIAVGDSSSDQSMLEIVENPLVFNPDEKLFNAAKTNKWKILIERKNVCYLLVPSKKGYVLKNY